MPRMALCKPTVPDEDGRERFPDDEAYPVTIHEAWRRAEVLVWHEPVRGVGPPEQQLRRLLGEQPFLDADALCLACVLP